MRTLIVAVAVVAVLTVLAVMRAAYDDGPSPARSRCEAARASANAVAQREDTVDDEVEYLRRADAAEKICADAD